jgi:hypothetical protein
MRRGVGVEEFLTKFAHTYSADQGAVAIWFVTAAGFAAGFLRDQIKQST